jgi:hypothetical protein
MKFIDYIKSCYDRDAKVFSIDSKISREERRIDKILQKRHNAMLKKLGLKPNATYEEINDAMLLWAENHKDFRSAYEITLSDEQQHDAEFLTRLYDANPTYIHHHKPHVDLHKNHEFIINCIRRIYEGRTEKVDNPTFFSHSVACVFPFKNTREFGNPEFINAMLRAFPEQPIIALVQSYSYEWSFKPSVRTDNDNNFYETMKKVNGDLLAESARRFGRPLVGKIPADHEQYMDILSAGIEKDGFDTLSLLPVTSMYENKNLIRKSFETYENMSEEDKKQKMSPLSFFTMHNHPLQAHNYMCHGEPHSDTYFSKAHLEFTYKFANDSKFWKSVDCDEEYKSRIIDKMNQTCQTFMLDRSTLESTEDVSTM